MSGIAGLLAGILGRAGGYLAAAGIAAALAGWGAGYLVHRADEAGIAAMKLADAKAQVQAVEEAARLQQSQDQVNLKAAVAEARAQQKIVTSTRTVLKEIPVHVPQIQPCIPYGLIRLLDDAATGSDTAEAPAAAGQSDDACAPLSWRAFAQDLIDDYGAGRANAEQLNALEEDVRALVTAANEKPANGDKENE